MDISKAFLDQGVLGACIVALGIAVVYLYKKVNEIQEKRIAESRESIKVIEQNNNTLETFTKVIEARIIK